MGARQLRRTRPRRLPAGQLPAPLSDPNEFPPARYDALETKASWSSSVRIQTRGRGSPRGNSQAWMDLQ